MSAIPTIRSVSMLPDPPQPGQPLTLTTVATEDDPADRLSHSHAWGDGSAATPWSASSVSPAKTYLQRTRYTATARHWTAEARDQHAAMGFEAGWGECANQLKRLCETGPITADSD